MNSELADSIASERRAQERVPVAIFGRCLLANQLEVPCQAMDISQNGLGVAASHSPVIGEPVIIYLDHVGRIEGTVVRIFDNGFALLINASPRKRQKLAAQIDTFKSDVECASTVGRRHERVQPNVANSEIRLVDGSVHSIQIVNISVSGAALKVDLKPAIGSQLKLAGMQGHVVRHLDWGFAMEFATSFSDQALSEQCH